MTEGLSSADGDTGDPTQRHASQSALPSSKAVQRGARPPRLLFVVLGLHATLAFTYTFLIPPDRGPDEPHHLAYIEHLHTYHQLPHLTSPTAARDERTSAIAIHPPLYYVAGWPLYEVIKGLGHNGTERVFRWLAVLMGAATVFLTWRLGATLLPENPSVALAAATFVAFLPEFQLLSSVMNNDGPMMLLSTVLLLLMVQRTDRSVSVKEWALLGVFYGITVMTKATGVSAFPVALALLALHQRKQNLSWKQVGARLVAYYLPASLLSAWWFLDLKQRCGRFHPIPPWTGHPLIHDSFADLFSSGRGWICIKRFLIGAQQSIWGQVDWFLPMNDQDGAAFYGPSVVLYLVFTVVSLAALTGLVVLVVRTVRGRRDGSCPPVGGLALLGTHFLMAYAALGHYTLFVHPGGYQGGRYLYASVAAFGTLSAVGLASLLPQRWHRWLAPALLVGLLLWNFFCALNLIGYLNPLYAPGEGVEINL